MNDSGIVDIRSSFAQKVQGLLAALILKALLGTLRWERDALAQVKAELSSGRQRIFAFWHGRLLGLPGLGKLVTPISGKQLYILISRHSDGRLIAEAIKWFGIESVAGSSSKGGREAITALLSVAEQGHHLGITPDGPRGPVHECKFGVVALSQKAQLDIVPVAYSVDRKWKLRSWDGMIVPKPFARATLVFGEPILVTEEEDLDQARIRVQNALNAALERADAVWTSL